jgi:hypothetical protein
MTSRHPDCAFGEISGLTGGMITPHWSPWIGEELAEENMAADDTRRGGC